MPINFVSVAFWVFWCEMIVLFDYNENQYWQHLCSNVRTAIESLRLGQVLDVFANRKRTTPKQFGVTLGVKDNIAPQAREKAGEVRSRLTSKPRIVRSCFMTT